MFKTLMHMSRFWFLSVIQALVLAAACLAGINCVTLGAGSPIIWLGFAVALTCQYTLRLHAHAIPPAVGLAARIRQGGRRDEQGTWIRQATDRILIPRLMGAWVVFGAIAATLPWPGDFDTMAQALIVVTLALWLFLLMVAGAAVPLRYRGGVCFIVMLVAAGGLLSTVTGDNLPLVGMLVFIMGMAVGAGGLSPRFRQDNH
ncbi:MAG: hypothetical protein V4621_01520 [Pseudomonadota bacterium]